MKSQSGVFLGQNSNPPFLVWSRDNRNLMKTQTQPLFSVQPETKENHPVCLTVTQVGMRSHLFRTKIRCFHDFSFFMYVSMLLDRVPMGSRASSTWITTSEESITYLNKPELLNDHPALLCSVLTWCTALREAWIWYLVKFSPDPLGLTLLENLLTCFLSVVTLE